MQHQHLHYLYNASRRQNLSSNNHEFTRRKIFHQTIMNLQGAEGDELNNDLDNVQDNNTEQIIQIIQRKDATSAELDRAVESLYKEVSPMMFRLALRNVQNLADAEDIVQTVFTKFLTYLRNTEQKYIGRPEPYLAALITTHARDLHRKYRRLSRVNLPIEYAENLGKNDDSIDGILAEDNIQGLLKFLRNPQDEATLLYIYFYNMDAEEVAERLGTTMSNVYVRKHRALKKLRQIMTSEDFSFWNK